MRTVLKCVSLSIFAFFAFGSAACNGGSGSNDASTDGASDGSQPATCQTQFDCKNAGDLCFYPVNGGCTLQGDQGVCFSYNAAPNCTPNVACGCDGTTISVCAPAGYVNRFSQSAGACPVSDAGADGDSATDDASDAADALPE